MALFTYRPHSHRVSGLDLLDLLDPTPVFSSPFGLSPMQHQLSQAASVVDSLNRQLNQLERKYARDLAVSNRKDRFEVALDCSHFKPDEINVKLNGNQLTVDAKHEERSDEHGFISRSFSRRYVLPDNVVLDKLESSLGPDGILCIKAPKKIEQAVESGSKAIPIELTSENYKPKVTPKQQEEPMQQ